MPTREELTKMADNFVAQNPGLSKADFHQKRKAVLVKEREAVRFFQGTTGEVVAVSQDSDLTGNHFFIKDGTDELY